MSIYAMNAIYATLPGGCSQAQVQGGTYYVCGGTWFQPSFGPDWQLRAQVQFLFPK